MPQTVTGVGENLRRPSDQRAANQNNPQRQITSDGAKIWPPVTAPEQQAAYK